MALTPRAPRTPRKRNTAIAKSKVAKGRVANKAARKPRIAPAAMRDEEDESNETFQLVLSNPSNATLGKSSAIGTITNDDDSGYFVYIPFVIAP
jgi:hypothetical protein